MTEKELLVKQEPTVSDFPDMDITIERCPHDEDNPYTMILNDLIRDASISPECRWLIIYLLSNKVTWTISVQQIINHLKGQTGRDRVYEIINEAIEAGYMKREITKKGNLKQQTKYFVSEKPKFKKILRHPESQYPEIRDPENTHIKNKHTSKKDYSKEGTLSPPIPPHPEEKAAEAAEEILKDSPKEKSKRTRIPAEFSSKVKDLADKMVNSLHEANPDWLIPKNLHAMMQQIEEMITDEKRDPNKILDVFMWAVSDFFWMNKLCKPNPAKYLRGQFGQLSGQMNAKAPASPNQVDRRLKDKEGKAVDEYKDLMF